ncbi:MAG: hypothetical protein FD170_701 [Bacteroidetes bacterium]|nr:MAG: hypothetical protein FD170_701 [Bacteroidota bacterium]
MNFNPLAGHFIIIKASKKTKLIVPLFRKGEKRGIKNCQLAFDITPSNSPCEQGENRSTSIYEYSMIFVISGMNFNQLAGHFIIIKASKKTKLIVPLFRKGEKRGIKNCQIAFNQVSEKQGLIVPLFRKEDKRGISKLKQKLKLHPLHFLLRYLNILNIQLNGLLVIPLVFFNMVANAERFSLADVIKMIALLKCYSSKRR